MGAGERLGARPGGGGGEVERAGVHSRGVVELSWGGDDGERGLSGAAHGRRCVLRGLVKAWALLLGPGLLWWWPG